MFVLMTGDKPLTLALSQGERELISGAVATSRGCACPVIVVLGAHRGKSLYKPARRSVTAQL